jgi:hypothetical protein
VCPESVEALEKICHVMDISAAYLHGLFSIAHKEVGSTVEGRERVRAQSDLKGAGLKCETDGRLRVEPFGQLVVVLRCVRTYGTQVEPTRDLSRSQMRPVVVVDLMTDEDRSILSEPKNEVSIGGHPRIDSQEMRVNPFSS